jgi:hypothetical protein
LLPEIKYLGYTGSLSQLERLLTQWRRAGHAMVIDVPAAETGILSDPTTGQLVSPIVAAALCIKPRGLLTEPQAAKVNALVATFVVPAFADDAPKKGSDADDAFMTGIRKLGVMSGEAFACSSETDQPQIGKGAIDLATQVSLHFGLQAAFIYSGSFGYGTGHGFDHKTCPQTIADFKALQAKYLGR